ncbi:hypothetical protein GXW74_04990 [Roseomonas eburnea]|uniref:Uncharacterized protein n=1 Tax=Neoroseomonas eburnea TaxID=1346889 RepID=A0A9X9X7Z6_9PROT|nr:hypothetical protein [Neoroseomonas eburnea]MBR0679832.1 hypothetical protein [Neoroseomonas eburnea]
MPLFQHDQNGITQSQQNLGINGDKACGASCILCTAAEFGTYAGQPNDSDAKDVYQRIWRGQNDESEVSKIVAILSSDFNLKASIIEDRAKTGKAGLRAHSPDFEVAYAGYKADIQGLPREKRDVADPFKESDFDGDARLMLVVVLPSGLTHWVLARRWNGSFSVMNPDGGTEDTLPGIVAWMNAPFGTTQQVGTVTYNFAGIVLRVTP